MTKSNSKRLRKLTEQELDQLETLKDSCCEAAVTPIKITQKTTAGYALDFTKYLASGYVDQAFKHGWDEMVSNNQDEKNKTEDPTNKVYRNSIALGAASWFAIPAVIATVVTISSGPAALVVAPIAYGVAALFGVVGAIAGAIDGFAETRTIKRAIELGKNNAQKEMSGIVNREEERAKLKDEIKNELIREKIAEKSGNNVEQDKKSITNVRTASSLSLQSGEANSRV